MGLLDCCDDRMGCNLLGWVNTGGLTVSIPLSKMESTFYRFHTPVNGKLAFAELERVRLKSLDSGHPS